MVKKLRRTGRLSFLLFCSIFISSMVPSVAQAGIFSKFCQRKVTKSVQHQVTKSVFNNKFSDGFLQCLGVCTCLAVVGALSWKFVLKGGPPIIYFLF